MVSITASKYPSAFGFDVHIDDAAGVALEGEKHHFKTIITPSEQPDWVAWLLSEIEIAENLH